MSSSNSHGSHGSHASTGTPGTPDPVVLDIDDDTEVTDPGTTHSGGNEPPRDSDRGGGDNNPPKSETPAMQDPIWWLATIASVLVVLGVLAGIVFDSRYHFSVMVVFAVIIAIVVSVAGAGFLVAKGPSASSGKAKGGHGDGHGHGDHGHGESHGGGHAEHAPAEGEKKKEEMKIPEGRFISKPKGAFFHLLPPDTVLVRRNTWAAVKGKGDWWYTDGFQLGRIALSLPILLEPTAQIDMSAEQWQEKITVNPGGEGFEVELLLHIAPQVHHGTITPDVAMKLLTAIDKDPGEFIPERIKSVYQQALATLKIKGSDQLTPDRYADIDAIVARKAKDDLAKYGFTVLDVRTQHVHGSAHEEAVETKKVAEAIVPAYVNALPDSQKGWGVVAAAVVQGIEKLGEVFGKRGSGGSSGNDNASSSPGKRGGRH